VRIPPVPVPEPKKVEVEERKRVRVDDEEEDYGWRPHLPELKPLTREQQQQAAVTTVGVGTVLLIGAMILLSPVGI
jgi:hypothetical protein